MLPSNTSIVRACSAVVFSAGSTVPPARGEARVPGARVAAGVSSPPIVTHFPAELNASRSAVPEAPRSDSRRVQQRLNSCRVRTPAHSRSTMTRSPSTRSRSQSPACRPMHQKAAKSTAISSTEYGRTGQAPTVANKSARPSDTAHSAAKIRQRPRDPSESLRREVTQYSACRGIDCTAGRFESGGCRGAP